MNHKATEIHRHILRTLRVILEIIFSKFPDIVLIMGLMRFRMMVMMITMVMMIMRVMQAMKMRMIMEMILVVLYPHAK